MTGAEAGDKVLGGEPGTGREEERATAGTGPQSPVLAVGAVVELPSPSGSGGAVERSLLLVKRGHPPGEDRWSVPGGRVEAGETLENAVAREVREETGLEVSVGDLIGWVERTGPGYHFVIVDFRAQLVSLGDGEVPSGAAAGESSAWDAALRPGDDASDAAWVPVSRLYELDLVDGLLDFLVEHGVVGA